MSGCLAARRDFDGADDLGDVVAVDRCGGGWVEAREDAVEVGWAAFGGDACAGARAGRACCGGAGKRPSMSARR